jgi:hypothetical protein
MVQKFKNGYVCCKKKPQQTSNRKEIKRFQKMHATRIQKIRNPRDYNHKRSHYVKMSLYVVILQILS